MCKGFIDFLRQYLAEAQSGDSQEQELREENKDSVNAKEINTNKYNPTMFLRKT